VEAHHGRIKKQQKVFKLSLKAPTDGKMRIFRGCGYLLDPDIYLRVLCFFSNNF